MGSRCPSGPSGRIRGVRNSARAHSRACPASMDDRSVKASDSWGRLLMRWLSRSLGGHDDQSDADIGEDERSGLSSHLCSGSWLEADAHAEPGAGVSELSGTVGRIELPEGALKEAVEFG